MRYCYRVYLVDCISKQKHFSQVSQIESYREWNKNWAKMKDMTLKFQKKISKIYIYYIFEAILILFLVILEDDKSDNFLRGDKSF